MIRQQIKYQFMLILLPVTSHVVNFIAKLELSQKLLKVIQSSLMTALMTAILLR